MKLHAEPVGGAVVKDHAQTALMVRSAVVSGGDGRCQGDPTGAAGSSAGLGAVAGRVVVALGQRRSAGASDVAFGRCFGAIRAVSVCGVPGLSRRTVVVSFL